VRQSDTLWSAAKLVIRDAWALRPGRIVLVGVLTVLQGLLDGFAMALLFPLIALLGFGGASPGAFVQIITAGFQSIGLEPSVATVLAFLVGAVILQNALSLWQIVSIAGLTQAISSTLKKRLWDAYLGAEWPFFVQRRAADLTTAVANVDRVSNSLVYMTQFAATSVVTAVYVGLAVFAAWQVSALLLIVAVLSFGLTRAILSHAQRAGQCANAATLAVNATTAEAVRTMKLVKATGGEAWVASMLFPLLDETTRRLSQTIVHPTAIRAAFEVVAIATIAAILVGATEYALFDAATVLAILVIFVRIYPRLATLQQFLHGAANNLPAIPGCYRLLDDARRAAEKADRIGLGRALPEGPIGIRLSGATVRFGETLALDHVDLDVPWGKMVGIVGLSGAGKTTLIDAILGLAPLSAGEITLAGVPVSEVALTDWRRRVGYVGQEAMLFNASVRANIEWGARDPSDAEIESAAKLANAHGFIAELPNGYSTELGDAGGRISGGQRQRIGLARALIGGKDVLILDEATSALDSESEAPILGTILKLKGTRTIFVVAHRLSSIRDADEIVVLDRGRVVERGDFAALLAREGAFARMWRLQTSEAQAAAGT
jgi:ATP-binding cassette, subfamily C, bacterial